MLPKDFTIIDLTEKVEPGKVFGPLNDQRRYEIKPFDFPPGETMHEIIMESHISTHIEAPSHFLKSRFGLEGKDISELSLESFIGDAIFIDLSSSTPRQVIQPKDLEKEGVSRDDIVLIGNSPYVNDSKPWLSEESCIWLAKIGIKMIGFDRTVEVDPQHSPRDLTKYFMHEHMLVNDIPIIEVLHNLHLLPAKRFLFIGFPAKMGGLDSFPIRAVAIIPKNDNPKLK